MAFKYAQQLAWIDVETDGLPEGDDFSTVNVLEFAMIVTDFDLEPQTGYTEVVKLTKAGADRIRANDVVKDMHMTSGLIKDSAAGTFTLAEVEEQAIETLKTKTSFEKGQFMIAGSGVAAFDFPLIKQKMPELAKWFAYYPFDIGIFRRVSKIMAGRDIINPNTASYGESKAHRALADVQAHMEEAGKYRDWIRAATS